MVNEKEVIMSIKESKDTALNLISKEYDRAISLFSDFKSPHEGYAILLEEVEELWDEIKHDKKPGAYDRMRTEATQVGAMALRFLVMLDEMITKLCVCGHSSRDHSNIPLLCADPCEKCTCQFFRNQELDWSETR